MIRVQGARARKKRKRASQSGLWTESRIHPYPYLELVYVRGIRSDLRISIKMLLKRENRTSVSDVAMRSMPFLLKTRNLWAIRALLLGPARIRRSGVSFSTYYDIITGRRVHPDKESPDSTIRIRLGAAMGRTFGACHRWKVKGWGWYTRWRSNFDEVEQDLAGGNLVRNNSETRLT